MTGDDDMLVAIWIDGFATGTASAALRLVSDATDTDIEGFSEEMARQVVNDPAVIETIREKINERLADNYSGPKRISPCIIQPRREL